MQSCHASDLLARCAADLGLGRWPRERERADAIHGVTEMSDAIHGVDVVV